MRIRHLSWRLDPRPRRGRRGKDHPPSSKIVRHLTEEIISKRNKPSSDRKSVSLTTREGAQRISSSRLLNQCLGARLLSKRPSMTPWYSSSLMLAVRAKNAALCVLSICAFAKPPLIFCVCEKRFCFLLTSTFD